MKDKRREAFFKVLLVVVVPLLALVSLCKVGKVVGPSMEPAYESGDYFLLFRYPKSFSEGDIIIMKDPEEDIVLKRVETVKGDLLWVLGDNRMWSYDSRDFGWLPASEVHGRVIFPRDKQESSITGLLPDGGL